VDAAVLLDDYAGVYARSIAPLAPVVADKSNVMGWSVTEGLQPRHLTERVHRSLSIRLSRRFEGGYTRHAAAIVVTSEEERRRFETLYGRRPEAVVPSAIDLPLEAGDPASHTIGWLGTHEYLPNVRGLVRFVEHAWEPLGHDGCRLLIAGGSPTAEVRALERFPGVKVLGYVDRLDDFFAGLAAAVVPLWQGAGVKLKTLTFMGAGIPVAATSVAVEGIAIESGRHCIVADDPAGLSRALREIVSNEDLGRGIGAEARQLVSEHYTWDHVGPRFVDVVQQTAMGAKAA
jgi:glycosyltransferase involved in cell wall biosynthesis